MASDPGVYLQYGYWIAGHGTARIPESAAAFGGTAGLDFATTGFTVSGGSRSRRRTCQDCRWCWPRAPGWAASAARC